MVCRKGPDCRVCADEGWVSWDLGGSRAGVPGEHNPLKGKDQHPQRARPPQGKICPCPEPWALWMDPIWKSSLPRCKEGKELQMRPSWVGVHPTANDKDRERKGIYGTQRPCDDAGREGCWVCRPRNSEDRRQGPEAGRGKQDPPRRPSEGSQHC